MWVAAGLGSFLAVVFIVLSIPVDIRFSLNVQNTRATFRARAGWFFNRFSWEIRPGGESRKKTGAKGWKRWSGGGFCLRVGARVLRTPGLLRQVKRLVRDLAHSLQVRELGLKLRVGLGDPYDTGMLFALVGPAVMFARTVLPRRAVQIAVTPEFDGAVIEGRSWADVRIWPIRAAGACLRLVCSLAALRAAWRIAAELWKRRER